MEHDTKTDKKSKTTGTLPKSFYTPIDNGSSVLVPNVQGTYLYLVEMPILRPQ
jgi:hypothetical protein